MTRDTEAPEPGAPAAPFRTFAGVLVHALLSRIVYEGGFVFGALLKGQAAYQSTPLPSLATVNGLLAASARNYGDYEWYWSIVLRGYARRPFSVAQEENWAFFPLQALMIRLVGRPGFQFLVANLAFLAAVAMLFAYLRRSVGETTARAAVLLMVYFPFSYSISQFRPETFLLAFSAAALLLAQRGRRWDGALAAAIAGLAKPNAFLLGLLLLPEVLRTAVGERWDWRGALRALRPSALVLLAAPLSGLAFMSLYLWDATGQPLAWAKIQGAWNAGLIWQPVQQLGELFSHPMLVGRSGWDPTLFHWAVLGLAVLALVWLLRARRPVFALYVTLYAGLTFVNFGVYVLGKHLSVCFPLFVGLALLLDRRRTGLEAALVVSAGMLMLLAVLGGLGFGLVRA